jgi:hypothetical protein
MACINPVEAADAIVISEENMNHSAQKSLGLTDIGYLEDEETTDVGFCNTSDTESSSGMSCQDGEQSLGRRCRFGGSALGTVPKTPSHASCATLPTSPPGLSRAAMRRARDACKSSARPDRQAPESSSESASVPSVPVSIGASKVCRFGISTFETLPKTPAGGEKLKAYKNVFGSPPGLSHAGLRQDRDACKLGSSSVTSWGSCSASQTKTLQQTATRMAPRERLSKMKKEASLLKQQQAQDHSGDEDAPRELDSTAHKCGAEFSTPFSQELELGSTETGMKVGCTNAESSEEEASSDMAAINKHSSRFEETPLRTVPLTSTAAAASCSSPCRAAMRKSRDLCKIGAPLTISPSGAPLTPPALRRAKQRVVSDTAAVVQKNLMTSTLPQAPTTVAAR